MNKKYLILGIVLFLVVGLTNMARANSFNDTLNTLSNQLYWLRDRLTAQVQTIENPMGSHENPYARIKEHEDRVKKFSYCSKDSDCYFPSHPCACHGGSGWSKDATITYCDNWKNIKDLVLNRKYSYRDIYPFPMACPAVMCPFSIGVSPNQLIPTRCNNGFCEIDTTKDINSKKYVILKSNGECTLVDVCKTKKTEVVETLGKTFETLEECNQYKPTIIKGLQSIKEDRLKQLLTYLSKENIPTLPDVNTIKELQEQIDQLRTEIFNEYTKRTTTTTTRTISITQLRQQRDSLLRQLATLQGKTTVPTLPNVNTVTELQAQIKQLLTEIAAIQANRRTTTTTNRLKYLCDTTKKTCELVDSARHVWTRLYNTKEECEGACKGTTATTIESSEKPRRPVVTNEMKKCAADQDCGFGINHQIMPCTGSWQFGYGKSSDQVAINRNSQGEYDKLWNSYLKNKGRVGLTVMCNNKENTKESKCVNNLCELVGKEQTNPNPTENWYKLTEFQGCNLDDFSRNCYGTNAAKNSGNEAKYCMNEYLLSKKIAFTDLTVPTGGEPIEGAVTCMSCDCGKPDIYIKAKNNFEKELNAIGFTKSDGPNAPVVPTTPIKTKTTIDLSHQELYYKEDKDTNEIKYAIISSNDKSVCGDNVCSLKENYLYKLDLTKSCSVYVDKVINFSHCHQDCRNTTEQLTGAGISKEEFNALDLSCTNQPEKPKQPEKTNTIGMPQPAKPIAQMTQAEKNVYVMQLQTFLIQLLTQYLALIKR